MIIFKTNLERMNKRAQMLDTHVALKAFLDNSSERIAILSPTHEVLVVNKLMEKSLLNSFQKGIEVGGDYREFVIAEKLNTYLDAFNRVIKGETIIQKNVVLSENTAFDEKMTPLYDSKNQLIGITLTHIVHVETELEHSTEIFEAIFENTAESIVFVDKDCRVIQFNTTASKRLALNMQKEIFVGADFKDFLYPKQKETFFTLFENALNGKNVEAEVLATNVSGNEVWLETKMVPVYNRQGILIGVSIYALSINARKKTEIALKESEKKFIKIVDVAPIPIIIADKNMNIILANAEIESVFGYKSEELKNQNIEVLIPERFHASHFEFQKDYMKKPRAYKMGLNRLTSAIRKDGEEIIVEVNLNSFLLNNERYVLAIIQDVTQRVKSEQQIANQLERLKSISWQQSHEVRKPVANILCVYNILKTGDDITNEEKQHLLDLLFEATEELDVIIHKIVKYANRSE
jgi:PAS domain S-box-containing protein